MALPAYFLVPEYEKSIGPEVGDFCSQVASFQPDPDQQQALDGIFAYRDDGLSIAFENAVIVGRQNLKTGLFKMCAVGWLFVTIERLIVWSAHELLTSQEAQKDLEELCLNSDYLRPKIRKITRAHGEEAIETRLGSRIIFKTRTKGGGRGLTGNKVVLDEAFALQPSHMGALLPTLSAVPNPQVLYGSAAGMADSEVLRDVRDRGRGKTSPRMLYIEYAVPDPEEVCAAGRSCTHAKTAEGCACDNPDMWLKSNPAVANGRMTLEYIRAERQAMPVDEFCRERMGWWDKPLHGASPMSLAAWYERADRNSTPAADSALALSIDVTPDRSMSAIGLAGWRDDGLVHCELVEHLPGTGWLIDRLMGIVERRRPVVVVLDPAGPAGAFEKVLRNKGFITLPRDKPLLVPPDKHLLMVASSRDVAQGCGDFVNSIANDEFRHPDQKPVNDAVQASRARPVAQAWAWDTTQGKDICPLVAVTLAKLGLTTYGEKTPPKPFLLV